MPLYLLLKGKGNDFKNMGVYRGSSMSAMKKKIQKWVDMGKKPKGQYLWLNNSSLKNDAYYQKSKK
tara:strand:+ start:61 stop:258 length:198 start_codon:yes stop_codon:yes gene_type:complete